jgi:hypothetical protein
VEVGKLRCRASRSFRRWEEVEACRHPPLDIACLYRLGSLGDPVVWERMTLLAIDRTTCLCRRRN